MSYIMIRHKVANYAKWKRAVIAFKKFRKASGEQCFYVCRGAEDRNDLLVWCAWDTSARMKKFAKSKELHEAMRDAGVLGKPVISFYSKMEDLSLG